MPNNSMTNIQERMYSVNSVNSTILPNLAADSQKFNLTLQSLDSNF